MPLTCLVGRSNGTACPDATKAKVKQNAVKAMDNPGIFIIVLTKITKNFYFYIVNYNEWILTYESSL